MDTLPPTKKELRLQKPQSDPKPDDIVIYVTDIQGHTVKPQNPRKLDRDLARSIRSRKPGRSYTTDFKATAEGRMSITFPIGEELQQLVEKAQGEGRRVFLAFPEGGVPLVPGKDLIERLQAEKRKGNLSPDLTKFLDAYSVNATLTI